MAANNKELPCLRWGDQDEAGRVTVYGAWLIMKNRTLVVLLWVVSLAVFVGFGIVTKNWALPAAFVLGAVSLALFWLLKEK